MRVSTPDVRPAVGVVERRPGRLGGARSWSPPAPHAVMIAHLVLAFRAKKLSRARPPGASARPATRFARIELPLHQFCGAALRLAFCHPVSQQLKHGLLPAPAGHGRDGHLHAGRWGLRRGTETFSSAAGLQQARRRSRNEARRAACRTSARKGDVDRLHLAVRSGPRPWFWFSCQMFKEAAVAGQVKILKYMLVHGIQLDRPPLDECLCTLCEACDDTDGGASVVAAARVT